MFHDHSTMRPETVSAQAFALAAADLVGGNIIRITGGKDDGSEVEIAFAAVRDGVAYDQTGAHEAEAWMDQTACGAGHGDFWCYETLRPQDVDRLRASVNADDAEAARLVAIASFMDEPIRNSLRSIAEANPHRRSGE